MTNWITRKIINFMILGLFKMCLRACQSHHINPLVVQLTVFGDDGNMIVDVMSY